MDQSKYSKLNHFPNAKQNFNNHVAANLPMYRGNKEPLQTAR
jgi:hypothetical protein